MGGANAGSEDAFIIKMNVSTGILDTNFGNGDGQDFDGIVQINNSNASSANGNDEVSSIALDGTGFLYVGGQTDSTLGGIGAGGDDAFILKMNASTGILDTSFGNGDGVDNDGIVQINDSNANSANGDEIINSIALDGAGFLYAGGSTFSSLGGTNAGGEDAFILKMNAITGVLDTSFGNGDGVDNDGIVQINDSNANSASSNDEINSIALDGTGALYAGGQTRSSLGGTNPGVGFSNDGFIFKMDTSTGVLDTNFGDGDGIDDDGIVQINDSNTNSASGYDQILSIALDGLGFLYAGGSTQSSLGGTYAGNQDGFILKMAVSTGILDTSFGDGDGVDSDGIIQINDSNTNSASSVDWIISITLDGLGSLYVGGVTRSSLGGTNGGGTDAYVLKMDASTGILDTSFGDGDGIDGDGIVQINNSNANATGGFDSIRSIALDGAGILYVGGKTENSLGGPKAGYDDAFIFKMDAGSGALDTSFGNGDGIDNDGILQINNSNTNSAEGREVINSIATDGDYLYVGGWTSSSLGGVRAGSRDIFTIVIPVGAGGL